MVITSLGTNLGSIVLCDRVSLKQRVDLTLLIKAWRIGEPFQNAEQLCRQGQMISELLPVLILAFIGFAGGYGIREVIARRRRAVARKKFYASSASNFEPSGMGKTTVNLEGDQVFSAAIAGLPKVAELIAAVPAADRVRALEAVEEVMHKRHAH
jgi:hypothetical protein